MFALGVTDLLVVLFRLLQHILNLIEYKWNDLMCEVLAYVVNSFYILSNWLLVSWTVERFIAVKYPFRVVSVCSFNNLKIVHATLIIFSCLINLPQLTELTVDVSLTNNRHFCEYSTFYYQHYLLFESFMYM